MKTSQQDKPVYYFSRMLPAYRVPVLDKLNQRLGGRLVVCHGQRPEGNPTLMGDVAASFRRVPLRNIWIRGETVHAQPFGGVFEQYGIPKAIIAEESPRSITLPFLLRSARRHGAARILWGIFYSVHRPYSSRHPLQQYRLRMARRVEACLCYSRRSRDVLATHVDPDRLFVAQNTLNTTELFELRDKLLKEGRSQVRKRLGLPDQPTFVFVGQLVARKGTDDLISFIKAITERQPATLVIIGDGPERVSMEESVTAQGLDDHVRFLGSISDADKLAPHIFASDVMVIPGYV
ncbi:MAG: glycosyltransferase, partial [Rhodothermales bacterium]|nr:glycosyltransferase [Rhodothermales bacterium]